MSPASKAKVRQVNKELFVAKKKAFPKGHRLSKKVREARWSAFQDEEDDDPDRSNRYWIYGFDKEPTELLDDIRSKKLGMTYHDYISEAARQWRANNPAPINKETGRRVRQATPFKTIHANVSGAWKTHRDALSEYIPKRAPTAYQAAFSKISREHPELSMKQRHALTKEIVPVKPRVTAKTRAIAANIQRDPMEYLDDEHEEERETAYRRHFDELAADLEEEGGPPQPKKTRASGGSFFGAVRKMNRINPLMIASNVGKKVGKWAID